MSQSKCWAKSLGDCRGDITGEHTLSKGVLSSKAVLVSGMPWCRDEPKCVGVASLVANRLCKHHNNALSECDAEAKRLFDVLDAAARLDDERRERPPAEWRSNVITHQVSGRRLERWLLKTLINITVGGRLPVGESATEPGTVDPNLVAIAFKRASFSPPSGFYGGAINGETVNGAREWEFQILGGDRVTGVLARLRTIRFGLSLIPHPLPRVIKHIGRNQGSCRVNRYAASRSVVATA